MALFAREPLPRGERGMKGYYRRPSKAIENGGGFFVPGLEGERIRLLSSVLIGFLVVVNRANTQIAPLSQIITELVGLFMVFVLFLQGALPLLEEETTAFLSSSSDIVLSTIQTDLNQAKLAKTVERVASTILQTCKSANYALVLKDDQILAEIGPLLNPKMGNTDSLAAQSDEGIYNPSDVPMEFPPGTASVFILYDRRRWKWIISASDVAALKGNERWIRSFLEVPMECD